jgi:hypothetical protein
MRSRLPILVLALLLVLAPSASAQGTLTEAAAALRETPVYVDPQAERALSSGEVADLRRAIARNEAGPAYIAVLPGSAAEEAGGDPVAALRELALSVGEPGTYAAVIGDSFRAGATGGVLPEGRAGELAGEASAAERDAGTAAVLGDFVRRLGAARAEVGGSADAPGNGGGGGFPVALLLLLAVPLGLFALSRRRRRRQEKADTALVKEAARDDLIALGDDIRALDLDVEMPGVDAEAKSHYGVAVERYEQAEQALDAVRRPQHIERVTSLLEEGRWAMTAAKARLSNQPVPERRAPCFFDPRHGPSVTDVEWAPPGGSPRPVPACAADAQAVADGVEPHMREVAVGGRSVPYWQAGPAFAPWAGGFFGAGLLPGLFVGSMLGGAVGGFGYPDAAYGGTEDPAGGGDFGDFGGGDFGGGFGGGDFGGGGDF